MNISRKLLMTALFGFSMQAQAYDAIALKTKVGSILDFAAVCKEKDAEAQKVAQWLEDKINSTSDNYPTQDIEIITIARTITANTPMDTKIDVLSKQMAKDLAAQAQREAFKSTMRFVNAGIALTICVCLIKPISHMIEFYNDRLTNHIITKTPWSDIFKNKLFA